MPLNWHCVSTWATDGSPRCRTHCSSGPGEPSLGVCARRGRTAKARVLYLDQFISNGPSPTNRHSAVLGSSAHTASSNAAHIPMTGRQGVQAPVAQPSQDPAFGEQDADFDLGLVAGFGRPGRNDDVVVARRGEGPVGMSCHIRATRSGTRRSSTVNEVCCELPEKLALNWSYRTNS